MIYWVPLLHFYQPYIQYSHTLRIICDESYRPLLEVLDNASLAKITMNMNAVLTEMLYSHGAEDIIERIISLAKQGKIEFTESSKYHAILPLIPKKEVQRQISLNHETNRNFFKNVYSPQGFFLPEMCYSKGIGNILSSLGYQWIILSGVACASDWPLDFVSEISLSGRKLKVFYRDDLISNKISFKDIDSISFLKNLIDLSKGHKDIYVITAMDGETFGHHIKGWDKSFLAQTFSFIETIKAFKENKDNISQEQLNSLRQLAEDLNSLSGFEILTMSQLIDKFPVKEVKDPKPSSWSTTKQDLVDKNYYPLWKNKKNNLHSLQWEHLDLCMGMVNRALTFSKNKEEAKKYADNARDILDKALYSCQFWWANKERNRWEINLINKGLQLQEAVVLNACKAAHYLDAGKKFRKELDYKMLIAGTIAAKIRDILLEE